MKFGTVVTKLFNFSASRKGLTEHALAGRMVAILEDDLPFFEGFP